MRPVATVLGTIGKSDDITFRGAMANIGGMLEARNEAWRKAVADWQSYSVNDKGWRDYIQNKGDVEWNAMQSYIAHHGTMGAKAQAHLANNIRELNKTLVAKERTYDVVGPVCETADYLGKNRKLSIVTGDLLLIEDVGAYGFSLSSNYNSRPRVAEYMLVDNDIKLIRSRENLSNMILDEIELLI